MVLQRICVVLKSTIKGLVVGFMLTTIYALIIVKFAPFSIDLRLFITILTVFPFWAAMIMGFYAKHE